MNRTKEDLERPVLSRAEAERIVGSQANDYGYHDFDYSPDFIEGFETALECAIRQLAGPEGS